MQLTHNENGGPVMRKAFVFSKYGYMIHENEGSSESS